MRRTLAWARERSNGAARTSVKREGNRYGEVSRQVRLQRRLLRDQVRQQRVQRRQRVHGRGVRHGEGVGRGDLLLAQRGLQQRLQHGVHAGLQRRQRGLQRVDQALWLTLAFNAHGVGQHLQEASHQPHASRLLALLCLLRG